MVVTAVRGWLLRLWQSSEPPGLPPEASLSTALGFFALGSYWFAMADEVTHDVRC